MRRFAVVVVVGLTLAGVAEAKAPRTASIKPGAGMGGVRIGQDAKVIERGGDQFVRGRRTRGFGPVFRFCFEGDQCAWKVRGGGFLTLTLNAIKGRVTGLSTNARGWWTAAGIRRGSTAAEVAGAYPAATVVTRCIGPAGAPVTGYRLRTSGNVTLFSLNEARTRVDRVHVVTRAFPCR